MSLFRQSDPEPLWRDEFSVSADHERYVSRRQFAKFLSLTSLGMVAGQVWILAKAWLGGEPPAWPDRFVTRLEDVPVGGVKLFRYPGPHDPCILVRPEAETIVAYSQTCTHLSCAVYYAAAERRLECPCHEGYFSIDTGRVLQGPPPRPLPRIVLERRGTDLYATGVELVPEARS
jgi:arsenite oxidase small subunit